MKKYYRLLVLLISVTAILFSSCSAFAQTPESNHSIEEVSQNSLTTYYAYQGMGSNANNTGYYSTRDQHTADFTPYDSLIFTDFATLTQRVLCNIPDCSHTTKDCMGYRKRLGNLYSPMVINDHVYYFYNEGLAQTEDDYEDALAHIEVTDLDGSNARVLYTWNAFEKLDDTFVYDERTNLLYGLITHHNGDVNAITNTHSLFSLNLETGEMIVEKEFTEFAESDICLWGCADNRFFIGVMSPIGEIMNGNRTDITRNYYLYSLEDDTYSSFFSFSKDTAVNNNMPAFTGTFANECFYLLDFDNITLSAIEMATGEKTILLDASDFQKSFGEDYISPFSLYGVTVKPLGNNHLLITNPIAPNEPALYLLYDLSTNTILDASHLSDTLPLTIVAETDTHYLIATKMTSTLTTNPNPAIWGDTFSCTSSYALISKDDYWAGNANLTEIETLPYPAQMLR